MDVNLTIVNYTNTSPTTLQPASLFQLSIFVTYIVEGALMTAGNLIFVALVLANKFLRRKELLLFAALAFGNMTYGFALFVAGIHRLQLGLAGLHTQLITIWECVLQADKPFFIVGFQIQGLMLVVVCTDRLLAIRWFAYYMTLKNRYAYTVIGFVFGYVAILTSIVYVISYEISYTSGLVPAICTSTQVATKAYSFYQPLLSIGCWVLSALVFGLGRAHYQKHKQQFNAKNKDNDDQVERQKKMTRLIGIIMVLGLVLYVIPQTAIFVMSLLGIPYLISSISPYLYVLSSINSIADVLILGLANPDVTKTAKRNLGRFWHKNAVESDSTPRGTNSSDVTKKIKGPKVFTSPPRLVRQNDQNDQIRVSSI